MSGGGGMDRRSTSERGLGFTQRNWGRVPDAGYLRGGLVNPFLPLERYLAI